MKTPAAVARFAAPNSSGARIGARSCRSRNESGFAAAGPAPRAATVPIGKS